MLKHKVIGLALLVSLLPVLVLLIITTVQKNRISKVVIEELDYLSHEYIAQIASDVLELCETSNELIQDQVDNNLNVARKILTEKGGTSFSSANITWTAVNQYSQEATVVSLPRMNVGGLWLGDNRDLSRETPFVDEVVELVGGTCTIFQRMNERGDMLRIATNVETVDKKRAIGTYIPAVDPDGEQNPVISAALRGEIYRGQAFVVNSWYVTAYEPIKDGAGKIVGVLYVGVKHDAVESIRQAIYKIKVGNTGYVYVLGGKAGDRGHYIISKDGERDGEDIWDESDSEGNLFIQSIINTALSLKEDEVGFQTYPWRNIGETGSRNKIVAIKYFEPWDWVIGAGMYEDDYYDLKHKNIAALNNLLIWSLFGGIAILGIAVFLAFTLSEKITKPIRKIISVLQEVARGNLFAAKTAVNVLSSSMKDHQQKGIDNVSLVEDDEQGEETLQLLTTAKTMTLNLFSLVSQVQRSGIQMTTSTTQIAASARQLESTVSEQAASSNEVVATTKEISATSRELVKTMDTVNEVALETASLADTGKQELTDMESTICHLQDATGSISSKLSIIREKTNNIDSIITTINKVADQTNLLSLNAAIEAEKAGEYGLGFSVVAREIRRLADQTAVSTLDIEHMVKEMQSAVSAGVMEMDKFTEEVKHAVQNVAMISQQLEKIIEQVQTLSPRIEEVHEGMQSQSHGAQQISEAMVQLNEATQQTSDSLHEFNNATEQLNEAARGLQNEVSRFKVSE